MKNEKEIAYKVVDWMLKETRIDTTHKNPSQWNIYTPHMGRWISPMGFKCPNDRHWNAFQNHVMDIYALDWELVGRVWDNYLTEVTKSFRQLANKSKFVKDDSFQYDYMGEGINNL